MARPDYIALDRSAPWYVRPAVCMEETFIDQTGSGFGSGVAETSSRRDIRIRYIEDCDDEVLHQAEICGVPEGRDSSGACPNHRPEKGS